MRVIFEYVLAKEQMSAAKNTRKRAKKSFYFVLLLCTEAESDREKHSVFFATHLTRGPPSRPSSHNNPRVVCRLPDTDSWGGGLV